MCTKEFINNEPTYELVSKVAYLIGVPKKFFTQEDSRFNYEIFKQLDLAKPCRILRNLCAVRTQILRNYKQINLRAKEGLYELSNVEHIDSEALLQLARDNASFVKNKNRFASDHLAEIERILTDRINNVRVWIPDWFEFECFKKLVLMPNQDDIHYYHDRVETYPYQMYVNFHTAEENADDRAKLLTNDYVFCISVYQHNGKYFNESASLRDVPEEGKELLMQFFELHKTCMIVDCENISIAKFAHMLRSLGDRVDALEKVIFVTGTNSSTAWTAELMSGYRCPVEVHQTQRILNHKSLVDGSLIAKCFIERYENQVNGFLLCSSDSDFSVLFENIPGVDFFVMVEEDNVASSYEDYMDEKNIDFTYLDFFYSGDRGSLNRIVLSEIKKMVPTVVFNINSLLEQALYQTCLSVDFTDEQRKTFTQKYLKTAKLVFESNGDTKIEFGKVS